MSDIWAQLSYQAGQVFTPGAPIREVPLFAGRLTQISKIVDSISKIGYHVVLYGERGVGKTSLSNVLESFLTDIGENFVLPRVNCDASDNFPTLWRKLFRDLQYEEVRNVPGFTSTKETSETPLIENIPDTLTPDDVRRILAQLSAGIVLIPIFDEFDRISSSNTSTLMADTIKSLSDHAVPTTVMIIGVAESINELINEHRSIERSLVQIPMPRMSYPEVAEVIDKGMTELEMEIDDQERDIIIHLSQGLPYVAHLLSLHATKSAISRKSRRVQENDIQQGIRVALDDWQQSVKTSYYNATQSHQPGNIYRQVVLACAFAANDDLGYFSAANVRSPLNHIISSRTYDIPSYARHLKQLSEPKRGRLLHRTGSERKFRYRFNNPLMKPYIIMKGLDEGIISSSILDDIVQDMSDSKPS